MDQHDPLARLRADIAHTVLIRRLTLVEGHGEAVKPLSNPEGSTFMVGLPLIAPGTPAIREAQPIALTTA